MSKKKKSVTAPLSYDPGKGRPKEYLAYLNWQEMQALQRLNGGNMERGPKGLPSFPPDWSGSKNTAGNWKGAPSGGGSGTSTSGGGSDSGSRGSSSSSAPNAAAANAAAKQQAADTAAKQAAETKNASTAARNSALSQDARKGGIGSINVGPMQAPVKIGGGQIAGTISGMAQQPSAPVVSAAGAYRPSAISPGGLATPGSIPISRAMNFAQSEPGLRQPEMAEAIKQAALTNKSLFSVEGATPQQQALVDRIGPTVLQESMTTGLDPRTMLGQALTESTTSRNKTKVSKLARDANNLFGVKATGQPNQFWSGDVVTMPTKEVINGKTVTVNEPFRKYDTPEEAVMDYSRLLQTDRYKKAAQFETPEQQLTAIRGGGYATHPAKSYVGLGLKNISRISFGGETSPTLTSGVGALPSVVNSAAAGVTPASGKPIQDRLMTYEGLTREVSPQQIAGLSPEDQVRLNDELQRQVYTPSGVAEGDYIRPSGVTASTIPGKYNYPVKPDGTPYTAEDIANLPPEIQKAHYEALMAERMGRVPYNLTQAQRERIAVAKGVGRVVNANPLTRAFVAGSRVLGGGLGLLPGAAGEFGEGLAEAGRQIGKPGDAVEDYVTASPLKQVQMEVLAGKPNRIPGTSPVYSGGQYAGGIPTQEPGGKGNDVGRSPTYQTAAAPYSGPVEAQEMGRPSQYYLWYLGVGIPSPGDPEYNDYQKYLRERGASAEV